MTSFCLQKVKKVYEADYVSKVRLTQRTFFLWLALISFLAIVTKPTLTLSRPDKIKLNRKT